MSFLVDLILVGLHVEIQRGAWRRGEGHAVTRRDSQKEGIFHGSAPSAILISPDLLDGPSQGKCLGHRSRGRRKVIRKLSSPVSKRPSGVTKPPTHLMSLETH